MLRAHVQRYSDWCACRRRIRQSHVQCLWTSLSALGASSACGVRPGPSGERIQSPIDYPYLMMSLKQHFLHACVDNLWTRCPKQPLIGAPGGKFCRIEPDHGRSRVFAQWIEDEDTIKVRAPSQ